MRIAATLKFADPTSASPKRVAILGIGNSLNGDDGVGVELADRLIDLNRTHQPVHNLEINIINGGPVPENYTGALRKSPPDLVLMIDAAQMNEAPGKIGWINVGDLSGYSASTHGMPLSLLANFLIQEYNCQVGLIGIQPEPGAVALTIDTALSPEVDRAASEIVKFLSSLFWEPTS